MTTDMIRDLTNENTALRLTVANQRAQLQTLHGVIAKRKYASRKMKEALDEYRRNDPALKARAEQHRAAQAVQNGPQPQPELHAAD